MTPKKNSSRESATERAARITSRGTFKAAAITALAVIVAAAITAYFASNRDDPTPSQLPEKTNAASLSRLDQEAPDDGRSMSLKLIDEAVIFEKGNPLPKEFDLVKPGDPLSLALSTYPSPPGKLSSAHSDHYYECRISNGPFDRIVFYYRDIGPDPEIYSIQFGFRGENNVAKVKRLLLEALGSEQATSGISGTIRWENLDGLRATVQSRGYFISSED